MATEKKTQISHMTIASLDRLSNPEGRAWLRAALKTVNAPLPSEATPEDMVNCVLMDHHDISSALLVAALIDEVPGRTLANIVSKNVFSYNELNIAMERIRSVGVDVTNTENGKWINEMAGFEMTRSIV
ncbi:hypothetical protein [Acetobacter pasteurianus]|uniref:hypothetical protein n=1 Tax=Acetobacter pasteurianus TaxID=438 RepID=UPI00216AE6EA|nr:hypothetical protein [Acetobacter pasteurianus]